jgi:hypothetical protein
MRMGRAWNVTTLQAPEYFDKDHTRVCIDYGWAESQEVRLLENQNMSQGQATKFAWQILDSNGTNAVLYSTWNSRHATSRT